MKNFLFFWKSMLMLFFTIRQIAAIATTRNFIVATRDTTPFVAAGVTVINPWEAGAEK